MTSTPRLRWNWAPLLGALFLLALAAPRGAEASPFDTYGFTSRAIAMGGSVTAGTRDVDAAYYNPAGATRSVRPALAVGVLVADDFLKAGGESADLQTNVVLELGLATPLPFGTWAAEHLFVTLGAALPTSGIFDVALPDDESVAFPFWSARNRRLALQAALAVRAVDWLSLGVGFALLADVVGDVQVDLRGSRGYNALGVEIGYSLAPTAGVLVEPLPWLAVGLTYRGAHEMAIDLPVDVQVLDGVPSLVAAITASSYWMPHEVALGFEFRPLPTLRLTADLTWYHYGAFRYPSPDVRVYDIDGEVVQESLAEPLDFHDVWAPRFGVEWWALPWLAVRGGYGYANSPVPAQSGRTNLMDADRNVVSLGLGFALPAEWLWGGDGSLAIDLHAQLAILDRRTFEKTEYIPENPGFPNIGLSGGTFNAGLSIRAEL